MTPDSLDSWFVTLLLAALVACGLIAAAAFRRLRREQQAVAAIRARARLDQWNAAGAQAVNRPPTELERVLAEHELAEQLRAEALGEPRQSDDAAEWWPFTDRRNG